VFSDHIVVHLHDLADTADFERQSITFRELLKNRAKLRVVVARHSREKMMLKLVLHASKEVLSDKIVAADSTCCLKVVCDVTIRGV
jgi:hypothetical protein